MLPAFLVGCPLPVQGNGDAGDDGGDAAPDGPFSDAPSDAPADGTILGDGALDGPSDGGSDQRSDGASTDGAVDASQDVEVEPTDAGVCGSGWRTLSKECDDGYGSDASVRRSCSTRCQVLDVLAKQPVVVDGGPPSAGRTLGAGRHPIAVTDDGRFAVAYVEKQPLALALTHFSRKGTASDVVTPFSAGSTPVVESNPVLSGLPGGRFAAAYAELGGDGDELGIALRVVTPGTPATGMPAFANQSTQFSQYNPDVVFAGGQLVVAWVDNSNPTSAPDVRFRTFDANLAPTSAEQTLAATNDAESDVALAPFAGSWAAAWRAGDGQAETIRVVAGGTSWSIGPVVAGPDGDKPALAELDTTHLLVVFSGGTDPSDSGVTSSSKLQAAILDTNAPGSVTPFDAPIATTLAISEPNAMRVGARTFLTWRTERPLFDPNGYAEEIWLKEIAWNGTAVDLGIPQIPLPRWDAHRAGDQRRAALAASALPASGALVTAWDDFGNGFSGEGTGDVVVELIPSPPLRTPGGDGGR